MLYKLNSDNSKFDKLEPVAYKDFADFGNIEKDLENLIANSLLDDLFEDSSLMPISQERPQRAEADIYALNKNGELIIFELKRSYAGEEAVHQILRYAQDAGQWSYSTLSKKYRKYSNTEVELTEAHKEAFNLDRALHAKEINNKQHLIVIGSAADDNLMKAVDYWKKQGISIEFLPYRIYEIGKEYYFEFFTYPYDKHRNPRNVKGVLFDTNRSYDENAIWYMMKNSCVAAFGDAKRFVEYVYPGDIVFLSHKGVGLVAAGKVKKGDIKAPDRSTLYRDIKFITPVPQEGKPLRVMPFSKVSEITGRSFYWARTIKHPYLSKEEASTLLKELKKYLETTT
jgi:Holliday junction resolvase